MKIFCIGRNYADHAKEMKSSVPTSPMVFMKPPTALLTENKPFYLPDISDNIHFEVELVVKIKKHGKQIEEQFSHLYYDEIGLGVDFTARDLQNQLKEKGHPWEIAKGFDNSAVVSNFIPFDKTQREIEFRLEKNGEIVQKGNSKDLIFGFDRLISYISRYFTLQIGDLIYTGTPAGVGPVKIGDHLKGYIGSQEMFSFDVK